MEILKYNETMKNEIDIVIKEAFTHTKHGYDGEVELTHALRESETPTFELVVMEGQQIVGHALLSAAKIDNDEQPGLVLAPLSVRPEYQHQGIGACLMQAIEKIIKDYDYQFISILGYPEYYHRFGYISASEFGVHAPISVPDSAFMLKLFNSAKVFHGELKYAPEFGI